jgi:hypothetical protein
MRQDAAPKVLVTITGGGFFWQSRSVARGLANGFALHYVTPEDPAVWRDRGLPDGVFHALPRLTTMADRSPWRKALNLISSFRHALRILRALKPQAVVCVATSLAVPLCIASRLLGVRTVFVESITRVSAPSTTGRILGRLRLCDRLYVQWPEAERLYPGAEYHGTVL